MNSIKKYIKKRKTVKVMKNKTLFVLLLSLTAIVIAGTAAYFSIFGLSKLFAGAGVSALILFGSLEFGKLVSVSVLYRFWSHFSWMIKIIFTSMVIGIMFITSMGIYGFLRNAYDKTSNEFNTVLKETKILNNRTLVYQKEIDRYQNELDSKNKQINTYIENRTTQEELVANLYNKSADTSLTSGESWTYRDRAAKTKKSIKETDEYITELRNENKILYSKINGLNDSISAIDRKIIELEGSDISVEIGPLKYLSDLTGKPMDDVVGALIFLIIFVFDPFAIILIIAANRLSLLDSGEFNESKKNNIVNKQLDTKDITKDIEDSIDKFINSVKEKHDITDKEIVIIKDDILDIKNRIDSLSEKEVGDDIKDVLKEFKEDIKSEFGEYVDIMNKKIDNIDNKDILNMVNSIKIDFNNRLSKVESAITKNDVSEITVPGRYSHRTGVTRPEKKV